eukprot:COSAG01_NODE_31427_length_597_cov_21.640805_1_plen_30_part_10
MLRPISALTTSALVLVLFATLNVSVTFGQS